MDLLHQYDIRARRGVLYRGRTQKVITVLNECTAIKKIINGLKLRLFMINVIRDFEESPSLNYIGNHFDKPFR